MNSFDFAHNSALEEGSGNAPGRREEKGNNYEYHQVILHRILLGSRDCSSVVTQMKKK